MKLSDQVAIVTGGAHGIGLGVATRLAADGAAVVIADIDAAGAEAAASQITSSGGRALALSCDVSDATQVDGLMTRTLEAFGRLDIVVNNAALVHHPESNCHFLELSEQAWQRALDVNLTGTFLCSQRAARIMVRHVVAGVSTGGNIINISSGGGSRAHRQLFNYDTTKGGIEAATRAMALDLAPWNIRVNTIVPGNVTVENMIGGGALGADAAKDTIPLGHPGSPADIGAAAAYLASDDARYVTGQRLFVDGGMDIQLRSPGVDTQPDTDRLNKLVSLGGGVDG